MCSKQKKYVIPILHKSESLHIYNFELRKEFLESNTITDADDLQVEVGVEFSQRGNLHSLQIKLEGWFSTACDRCSDSVTITIKSTQAYVVKQSQHHERLEDNDDVILYDEGDKEIDISYILYEMLLLSFPLRRVHKDGECNTRTMEILSSTTPNNTKDTIDPRWEGLKNMFKN